ncbi:MAG: glutamine-hydrolyzing GMP synthase [Ignavibacteriaceae bacterium]|nr:glutamine-hydrolyzing GMP synthase [Ignavibacteriaceae bacterium]
MVITDNILIIDFGSQFTQLIARKIRELNVYSRIYPHTYPLEEILKINPKGIILSGGPMSVYDENAPHIPVELLETGIPILGICYGLQLTCKLLGGKVSPASSREYGKAILSKISESELLANVPGESVVWMSHGDHVEELPAGFNLTASTPDTHFCCIENKSKNIYGVQFHPEVYHTESGKDILKNFVYGICSCTGNWLPEYFIDTEIKEIKSLVGEKKAICALSGGVDSTVAAVLINKAIGDKLTCVHIDNGLMRKNESETVVKKFRDVFNLNVIYIDAKDLFLNRLAGVTEPEKKRKIIGNTFIEVFEREAKKIEGAEFLVQGTLYPDVIESVPVKGASVTIKTHHNVGGLPEKMNLKLIEPLRELFKDEVRNAGRKLGIDEEFLMRHPFPGPGLAVRIPGEITREKIDILQQADEIYINTLIEKGVYDEIWQAFAVLLPVQSVGVMGDARTYEFVLALRAVNSVDGMTADWYRFDYDILAEISNKIINNVKGVNRVVYDISSKPPATIEWE